MRAKVAEGTRCKCHATFDTQVGMAASMGSFILGAGTRGKRIALPHSKTMIHQPMGGARGQAEDIRVQVSVSWPVSWSVSRTGTTRPTSSMPHSSAMPGPPDPDTEARFLLTYSARAPAQLRLLALTGGADH